MRMMPGLAALHLKGNSSSSVWSTILAAFVPSTMDYPTIVFTIPFRRQDFQLNRDLQGGGGKKEKEERKIQDSITVYLERTVFLFHIRFSPAIPLNS